MAKALKLRFLNYMPATVDALRSLGNSARPREVVSVVEGLVSVPPDDLVKRTKSGQTLFENDVHWCRAYLAKAGYIDSSQRGVWRLTESGRTEVFNKEKVDEVFRMVQRGVMRDVASTDDVESLASPVDIAQPAETHQHRAAVLDALKVMNPSAFEQFCRELLLESGFENVVVTGRSGDKGIDGTGVLKVNPLFSLKMVFQAKRYQDSVGSAAVRDFRGASSGRADRGLLITTSTFTRDAIAEASRDGAMHIELIDGEELVELMEKLEFGLTPTRSFCVSPGFFERFV